MRTLLIRVLARTNRLLKRLLGLQPPRQMPPPPPLYLERASWVPSGATAVRTGSWLFLIEHPSRGSGGLHDILHLGAELERQFGLQVWYTCVGGHPLEEVRGVLAWTCPDIPADRIQEKLPFTPEHVCATSWPTAYAAQVWPSRRKLYFVQDYEPWFHRAGVRQFYAEKSYELGLEMLTLGPWLAQHLSRRGHAAVAMPFPVTDAPHVGRPLAERRTVAVYLQADKPHRGPELMLEGARRLSRRLARVHPELELVLFGSAENEELQLDFPCTVHGVLAADAMTRLLRETRLGICASFTNVSLLTLRFPMHGCPVMDLNVPSVRENVGSAAAPLIRLYEPDPEALAECALGLVGASWSEDARAGVTEKLARGHSWAACAAALAPLLAKRKDDL